MNRILFSALLAATFFCAGEKIFAQGTAFNYQGRLNVAGSPANGPFDLSFQIFDAVTNGNAVTPPQTNFATSVSSGLFSVTLDFGAIFSGTNYWLAIGVRTNGDTNALTPLFPRQPILPTPYAIFATSASNLLGSIAANKLTGTLSSTQLAGTYSGSVNFTNSTNTFTGTFFGNGTNLSNLNGSQISGGTIADARLTTNVALLNANQNFTGNNNFTGTNIFTNNANSFTGNFFGNGLVGWIPVSVTSTQAVRDTGYLLLNSSPTTVTLPTNNSSLLVGDIVRISGAGSGGWRAVFNPGESAWGDFASYHGIFWTPSSVVTSGSGNWNSLAASADGTIFWAASSFDSQGIWNSVNSGVSFRQNSEPGTFNAVACSADGTKVFFGASSGSIVESTNGGSSWFALNNSSGSWKALACSADASKMVAVPTSGNVFILSGTNLVATTQSGSSWSAAASSADGSRFAVASGASVSVSVNSGTNWSSHSLSANVTALAISSDGLRIVAALDPGVIQISTNFGTNWTASGSSSAAWNCLAASADCQKIIAGVSNGLLYASSDFGANWNSFNTSSNLAWNVLAVSDDGAKAVAAATGGGHFYASAASRAVGTMTNAISGGQGSAVELQYIGGGQFMPVSSAGTIWGN